MPDYQNRGDAFNSRDGWSFYSCAEETLYYWSPGENILFQDWLLESGAVYRRNDFSLGMYADYMGSADRMEASLENADNIDLVLDESETGVYVGSPFLGGGISWSTLYVSGEVSLLDGDAYGYMKGFLPVSPNLYTELSGGYVPSLRINSDLLGDEMLNLHLNDLYFSLLIGYDTELLSLSLAYSHHYRNNDFSYPDEDGISLEFYWYTPVEFAFSGRLALAGGDLEWNLSYSHSTYFGEGRLYEAGDYDTFLTVDETKGLPTLRWKGDLSLKKEGGLVLGCFGEAYYFSSDRILINAPSTIVSTSYVYRYILENTVCSFWQTGFYGRKGFESKGKGSFSLEGSCSYARLSGESDILEIYGVVIPFVSTAEQNDMGLVGGMNGFLVLNGALGGSVNFPRGEFLLSLNQTLPVLLESGSGVAGGNGNSGASDFIWTGFRCFFGINLSLKK